MDPATSSEWIEALHRLVKVGAGDTLQSAVVRSFLLAWWNAEGVGGFDISEIWACDAEVRADMALVFAMLAGSQPHYADAYGYGDLMMAWTTRRLAARSGATAG